jgi:hypothetical protein
LEAVLRITGPLLPVADYPRDAAILKGSSSFLNPGIMKDRPEQSREAGKQVNIKGCKFRLYFFRAERTIKKLIKNE